MNIGAPNIGAMRERFTLEQSVRAPDGGGGATVTWQTVVELWARARPITGDERLRHDQLSGRLTHEVWIRYRPGVLPAMRFRQDTRIYEIVAVIEVDRRARLKCLCEERSL
jgi:SPP1 family predicted phage head-tail adaptor